MKRSYRNSNSGRLATITLGVILFPLALPYSALESSGVTRFSEAPFSETRLSTKLVLFTALVLDASGWPVTNLRHPDFKVFDKDKAQEIAFWTSEDQPASIAIVIDSSISATMRDSTWFAAIPHNILGFKDRSNELNEYSVISADLSPQLVTDWTTDKHQILEALSLPAVAHPKAKTGVFDACQLALNKLNERRTLKRALLLISDGHDTASKLGYSDLYDSMLRSDALIYLLCPYDANNPLASDGSKALTRLSVDSGASAFYPSSYDQLTNALGAIAHAIRDRYLVGYYPPGKPDGSWHPVRITASLPSEKNSDSSELVVRTRLGYYAPAETR